MAFKEWQVQKTIHLGNIKVTVNAGQIIEYNEEDRSLKIDGQFYPTDKDFIILKNNDWIKKVTKTTQPIVPETKKLPMDASTDTGVKVIKSDSDLMERDIDITHTQNEASKRPENRKAETSNIDEFDSISKQESRVRELNSPAKMPIVNGDEDMDYSGDGKQSTSLNDGQESHRTATAKKPSPSGKSKGKRGRPKGAKNKTKAVVESNV